MKSLISFKNILVTCSADMLVIENSRLRREFGLSAGAPRTRSLRFAAGTEFSAPDKIAPDLAFIGMFPAGFLYLQEALPSGERRELEPPGYDQRAAPRLFSVSGIWKHLSGKPLRLS